MSVVTKAALKAKFETGDFPTQQNFTDFVDTVYPYEKYVALLTETTPGAPVATVLENTLGGTVVWSYNGVGDYTATLASAFTANKTVVIVGNVLDNTARMPKIVLTSTSAIQLLVYNGASSLADNALTNTPIEIRVYP